LADEIVRRGAAPGGLTWHFARPPVQGLDFEMGVRGVRNIILTSPEGGLAKPLAVAQTLGGPRPERMAPTVR